MLIRARPFNVAHTPTLSFRRTALVVLLWVHGYYWTTTFNVLEKWKYCWQPKYLHALFWYMFFKLQMFCKCRRSEAAHWREHAPVGLERIRSSYWYLSSDKRFTHSFDSCNWHYWKNSNSAIQHGISVLFLVSWDRPETPEEHCRPAAGLQGVGVML
jgi:hypothetical protein